MIFILQAMIRSLTAFTIICASILAGETSAQDANNPQEIMIRSAGDVSLEEYVWQSRPLIVLANGPDDPRFKRQMELIADGAEALIERDVVVITDTDPAMQSPVRGMLRPRDFMLVLLAKDGTVVLRKPRPWDMREVRRAIDKLPLRQQEIREELHKE